MKYKKIDYIDMAAEEFNLKDYFLPCVMDSALVRAFPTINSMLR